MSSVPYILFNDQQVKLLRIILRDHFAADHHGSKFFMRKCRSQPWKPCTYSEWYDGIRRYAAQYMSRYSDVVHESNINRAIRYLYHRNIMNKIHGPIADGFSIR